MFLFGAAVVLAVLAVFIAYGSMHRANTLHNLFQRDASVSRQSH